MYSPPIDTSALAVAATESGRDADRAPWVLGGLASAAAIVVGIMMIAWPGATVKVGAILLGAWLLVQGLVMIVRAITATGAGGTSRTLAAVAGVLFLVAGVVCLRNLAISLAVVVTLIGLAWIIGGIVEVAAGITNPYGRSGGRRTLTIITGALSLLVGVAVLVWPALSLTTLFVLAGIWLILYGVLQAAVLIMTRSARGAATGMGNARPA